MKDLDLDYLLGPDFITEREVLLECVERAKNSNKFYKLSIIRNTNNTYDLLVNYGRKGARGVQGSKETDVSCYEAERELEALKRQKMISKIKYNFLLDFRKNIFHPIYLI